MLNPRTPFCNGLKIQVLIPSQYFQGQRLSGINLTGTFGLAFRLDGIKGDMIAGDHGITDFEARFIGRRTVGDFLHEVDM